MIVNKIPVFIIVCFTVSMILTFEFHELNFWIRCGISWAIAAIATLLWAQAVKRFAK